MILAMTIFVLIDIISDFLCQRFSCHRVKYDCSKCRNWKCSYHYCERKRRDLDE